MIPRVAHFVFGLREQREPFHFAHYMALESCRRVLRPEAIHFHHRHLPWGPWWDRIAPYLVLEKAEPAPEVLATDYGEGFVPERFRYAHHADFVRLDALIAHGGVYADIDTVFVRALPERLFAAPFVIGEEPAVADPRTGRGRSSLCNALLMAEPGAAFARAWRARMAGALDGTWSNHSGFLARALADAMPDAVHVEPEGTFYPFRSDRSGLAALLLEHHPVPPTACTVHLWAHLWWDRERRDFSPAHADWCAPHALRCSRSTLAELARPYLDPEPGVTDPDRAAGATAAPRGGPGTPGARSAGAPGAPARMAPPGSAGAPGAPGGSARRSGDPWVYLSLDEASGYGTAAQRTVAALLGAGTPLHWVPMLPSGGWGSRLGYAPAPPFELPRPGNGQVVVAHLVPEYYPRVRAEVPDAFLVGHTAWETDRLPAHWARCLDATDLVVVPSTFSARAVARSGTTAPVAVVPHALRPHHPARTSSWRDVPADVTVFYTVAEWNERKAPFLAVQAYLRAFTGRDRVLLVVKTSHLDHTAAPPATSRPVAPGTTAWALARLLAGHRDPPAVTLVTRTLHDDELDALHGRGDCFVSLCRGEGWGIGAFDAAAGGTPVVTTAFGGHLDYLAGTPWLVDADLVPVDHPMAASYTPDQRWAAPSVDHAADLLRQVAADREGARDAVAGRAADIRRRFGPQAVAAALHGAVAAAQRGTVAAAQRGTVTAAQRGAVARQGSVDRAAAARLASADRGAGAPSGTGADADADRRDDR